MYSKVTSSAVCGVDGTLISVEADVSDGLPMLTLVGYLSSSVKEAGERVRTALKNSGHHLPPKRITINLSPANIRKDGTGFDLAIAVSVLLCMGLTPKSDFRFEQTIIIGELGLNGSISAVSGILPMVYHAYGNKITTCIVPSANAREAALVKGMRVIGVSSLNETLEYIQGIREIVPFTGDTVLSRAESEGGKTDFSDIKGQEMLKRGMEIAAAGFHNVLMTGAAGAGKSMLAKRLPTIMPALSFEESIEITKIYSISGLTSEKDVLVRERPFRAPHHTISRQALAGGGLIPKPGEVSLAHGGVLFLDELPEFQKGVLEVLRQPVEDRSITIARLNAVYTFPADFMLVAAMNPCPCGNYPNLKKCTCSSLQIKKYMGRISGPLTDRIDINMQVKPVGYKDLFLCGEGETSEDIRARVELAREMQRRRYAGENIYFNSRLEGKNIEKYIVLGDRERSMLEQAFQNMALSARGTYRILKLARTIADLEGSQKIQGVHLQEAIFYRYSGDLSGGEEREYVQ